jgi:hypothetical protein
VVLASHKHVEAVRVQQQKLQLHGALLRHKLTKWLCTWTVEWHEYVSLMTDTQY